MITISNIIDGISEKLYETFGESYEIYTEIIEQDLKEPCFSIVPRQGSVAPIIGRRYFKTSPFVVYFFPSERNELWEITEKLYECLEYITVDDDLRQGTKMSHEVSDGVLVFMVNYDAIVVKDPQEKIHMENHEQNISVKE